jgi:hypothetical protein
MKRKRLAIELAEKPEPSIVVALHLSALRRDDVRPRRFHEHLGAGSHAGIPTQPQPFAIWFAPSPCRATTPGPAEQRSSSSAGRTLFWANARTPIAAAGCGERR